MNGYDRHGEILGENATPGTDGNVTLRDAHFYTLANAHSTDLSRSTSEDFLDRWQPWYLKWLSARQGLPNNEYAKLYRSLADKHGIIMNTKAAKTIRNKLEMYQQTTTDLLSKRKELRNEIKGVQKQLVQTAKKQWPALNEPYTAQFQSMAVSGQLIQVAAWLRDQPGYKNLVDLQNEDDNLEVALLDAERNATQMQKLFHFRKLANLKSQLYQHGDPAHISSYEKLVECESAPLVFNENKPVRQATSPDN